MMHQPGRRNDGGNRARGIPSRAVPARSIRALIGLLLMLPYVTGCYHYVPASNTRMALGADVEIAITDSGRVEVADRLGPGVQSLRGQVLQSTDSSLVVSVRWVEYIGNSFPVEWNGQWLELSNDLVTGVREKRFSRTRTLIMTGVVAAAATLVTTLGIGGIIGGGDVPNRPGDDPGNQM